MRINGLMGVDPELRTFVNWNFRQLTSEDDNVFFICFLDFVVPVLPVVLTVALGLLSVILLVTLYLVRRQRRQAEKYKQYSQIAKTAVQPPEFTVKTAQQPQAPKKKLLRGLPEKILSSEESLSPMSSEEMFYDAQDRLEGRTSRSVSSREPSPASALEEDEDDEEEPYPLDHLGRVWFNLQYDSSAESLAVTLVKARNLSPRGKTAKTCDPFVKLHILCPEEKNVSQSKCKRKTRRPNFDEMFYFNLPVSELERCTLRLSVYDGYRASQQTVVGEVLFPLNELDINQKVELWRDLVAIEEVCEAGFFSRTILILFTSCYDIISQSTTWR